MSSNPQRGFEGSVAALSVADVLQLQGGHRFSGSIVFSYQGQVAAIFMQHGEVIHAEFGAVHGEEVLAAILAWPTGSFEAHANVATFARSIDKRLDHLLLDAARSLDEARQDGRERPPAQAAAPAPRPPAEPAPPKAPAAAVRARAVDGVRHAAVLRGGVALNDASPEGAALAARCASLLSSLAEPLGKLLGLGELSRLVLSNQQVDQLLLLHAKDAYLAVSLSPTASLADAEAAVRRAVSAQPGT